MKVANGQVPLDYKTETGLNLGDWVASHRRRQDKMPPKRRAEFEALPGWTWAVAFGVRWEQNIAAYLEFYDQNQHGRVPAKYKTENGLNLGAWVSNQRTGRGRLSPERKAEVEALPGWVRDPFETQWQQHIAAYLEFYEQNQHGRVPTAYKTEPGLRLGTWVSEQRKARDRMSPERRAEVDGLPGWVWDPHETQWRENVAAYMEFYDQHQHGRVPVAHKTETGLRLGSWASDQRKCRDKMTIR